MFLSAPARQPGGWEMFMYNGNSNLSWNGNPGLNTEGVIAHWFCPVIVWQTRPGAR
jgi:hypothetical protein